MNTRTQVIMGTFISISLEEENKKLIENGFVIFKNIDESISSYNEKSLIYQLNLNKSSPLNDITYEALILSKKYYEQSDAYFDITVASITKDLYHFGGDERIPSGEELRKAHLNFNGLVFDKKSASIEKNIKLDLGGMGKGFAVDKVSSYFKSKGITKTRIAASGDIRCLGICKIEVQNPFSNGRLALFSTLKNETGISTSGNYNRYVETTKNNHLINPKLKASQENFISITLISNISSSDLDAYATASSVMPPKKAFEFLDSFDLAYIILKSDGELRVSKNISEFTKDLVFNYAQKKQKSYINNKTFK